MVFLKLYNNSLWISSHKYCLNFKQTHLESGGPHASETLAYRKVQRVIVSDTSQSGGLNFKWDTVLLPSIIHRAVPLVSGQGKESAV